jgi:pimeloyl-ACP methyl ester carboxylesterase
MLALRATWPEIASGLAGCRPSAPVLLLHGEADPVVPVEHAHEVAAWLPRATPRTFPGDLHDVLNEHDRDAVHDIVAAFAAREFSVMTLEGRTSDAAKLRSLKV